MRRSSDGARRVQRQTDRKIIKQRAHRCSLFEPNTQDQFWRFFFETKPQLYIVRCVLVSKKAKFGR